jgi:hypothetical protein
MAMIDADAGIDDDGAIANDNDDYADGNPTPD